MRLKLLEFTRRRLNVSSSKIHIVCSNRLACFKIRPNKFGLQSEQQQQIKIILYKFVKYKTKKHLEEN